VRQAWNLKTIYGGYESISGLLKSLKIPSLLRKLKIQYLQYISIEREQRKCINIAAFACSLPKPEANQG
jgi:hypothetical protein